MVVPENKPFLLMEVFFLICNLPTIVSRFVKYSQCIFVGIHAREWISSAVSTYIVNELVHNSTKYEDLLRRFDFYIIPLLNPDGYAHSCNYNRLWRKSRKANDLFFGYCF